MKSTKITGKNVAAAGLRREEATNAPQISKITLTVTTDAPDTYDVNASFDTNRFGKIGNINAVQVQSFVALFDDLVLQAMQEIEAKQGDPISRSKPPRPPKIIEIAF